MDCLYLNNHLHMECKLPIHNRTILTHKVYASLNEPRVKFCIFRRGGKVLIWGGKSIADVSMLLRTLMEKLEECGETVEFKEPTINNICSTGYLGYEVKMNQMSWSYPDSIEYNTEQFAGARCSNILPNKPAINCTIFASGKIIITGSKLESDVIDAYEAVLKLTQPYAIEGTITDSIYIHTNIKDVDSMRILESDGLIYT